jgi:hypothetical protein
LLLSTHVLRLMLSLPSTRICDAALVPTDNHLATAPFVAFEQHLAMATLLAISAPAVSFFLPSCIAIASCLLLITTWRGLTIPHPPTLVLAFPLEWDEPFPAQSHSGVVCCSFA